MEPEGVYFTKLNQILEGLKSIGVVVDYKKCKIPKEGFGTKVCIKMGRGKHSEVFSMKMIMTYVKQMLLSLI